MVLIKLLAVVVVLATAINAHSISLRNALIPTENEPYQVFIACAGSTFDFGAGLPITRRHVLTAASLVRGFTRWNVGFGSATFNKLQYIESFVAYMHPSYNGNTFNNNLGIIVLPSSLPRTIVRPIRLPTENDGVFPRQNQEGRLVGFGLVNETASAAPSPNALLKTVYLTVSSNCTRSFPSSDARGTFCAGDDHPESMNQCRGDVGDAFVVMRRGEPVLAGITSIVSKGCKSGEPTSYVRVQSFLPWILSVTRNAESF